MTATAKADKRTREASCTETAPPPTELQREDDDEEEEEASALSSNTSLLGSAGEAAEPMSGVERPEREGVWCDDGDDGEANASE